MHSNTMRFELCRSSWAQSRDAAIPIVSFAVEGSRLPSKREMTAFILCCWTRQHVSRRSIGAQSRDTVIPIPIFCYWTETRQPVKYTDGGMKRWKLFPMLHRIMLQKWLSNLSDESFSGFIFTCSSTASHLKSFSMLNF